MKLAIVLSFLGVLAAFTLSGALAWLRKSETTEDYLIASRRVSPWLSALSAVSTNNSGFMFIAMIAFTYRNGIQAIWLVAGWILGDLTIWVFVHPKVRRLSGEKDANTLPALLEREISDSGRTLVVVSGCIVFLFLSVYAAAQLKAGSTALNALFGWDTWIGVFIGAFIVVLYSYAGGIRADMWTDAAQSFVMLATMAAILAMAVHRIGGYDSLSANLTRQDPSLMSPFPENLAFGLALYVASVYFNGLGVVGQPHVMTRFFALESADVIPRAGLWYFAWYVPFALASLGVGLYTRAIIPELPSLESARQMAEPTELALPLVTRRLLPDVFVGVSLAGLFAATISTADSQIIVCSGAVTHDVAPRWEESYVASKIGTFTVTALAMLVAIFAPEGVFGLVLIAWSAMGSSLGPVLVLRVFNRPLSAPTALAMMAAGILTVAAWHFATPNENDVFEMLPGAVAAFAVYFAVRGVRTIRGK